MKIFICIVLAAVLSSCSCKKNTVASTNKTPSDCPSDGKCTVELQRNKSLAIKTDEFGSIYYQILESEETSVIIYRYDKNAPEDLQDAKYREEIIFEINNKTQTLTLSDKELHQSKMLFGRFCFCKGQTGNYTVKEGNLNLKQDGDTIQFDLNFTVNEVPHIIKSIKTSVK